MKVDEYKCKWMKVDGKKMDENRYNERKLMLKAGELMS